MRYITRMAALVQSGSEETNGREQSPAVLTRTMTSRKLLALRFIKRYFTEFGHSPTLGELAAELGVSIKRAHALVHQLASERMIEVVAGKARGIRLIDRTEELSEDDVLLRLSSMGWTIGRDNKIVQAPLDFAFPLLDHEPETTAALSNRGAARG